MMKKILSFLLLCALVFGMLPTLPMAASAEAGDVELVEKNFPDANFLKYLKETFDTAANGGKAGDGWLTAAEIGKISEISCNDMNIANLKGIEHFTALTYLGCYWNKLTSLDVSKNTALTELGCGRNQLTSLDVSKNTALTELYCYNNQLTSLDLSKNTALETLSCRESQLTSLDMSKNTALETLICCESQLTSLDVSKNTALTKLDCHSNQLKILDVSKNTALTELNCDGNGLMSLDVSKNTALKTLSCGSTAFESNLLTSLDVSKNTALTELDCSGNQLTSLDVSKNTALTKLDCHINQLKSLDVSKNTALTYLNCGDNFGGNQLTSLDVSKNTALTELYCHENQLTSLDVSKNTALTELDCGSNQLTSLDLSANVNLGPGGFGLGGGGGCLQIFTLPLKVSASSGKYVVDLNQIRTDFGYNDFDVSRVFIPDGTLSSDGKVTYDTSPSKVSYRYSTNLSHIVMEVEITIGPNATPPEGSGTGTTGTIASYGDAAGIVTIELWQNGVKKYTRTGTASYDLSGIPAGTYTMTVSKPNHATREYTIKLGSEALPNVTINMLGDVDMSGELNMLDIQKIFAFIKNSSSITDEYQKKLADVDENKIYNMLDIQRLFNAIKKA